MSTIQFPDSKEVEIQAANWIAAIDRGLTETEESNLKLWLEASPMHGEMLLKCASMWDLLDLLSPIAKLLPMSDDVKHEDAGTVPSDDVKSRLDESDPVFAPGVESSKLMPLRSNKSGWKFAASFAALAILVWGASSLPLSSFNGSIRGNEAPENKVASEQNAPKVDARLGKNYSTTIGEISNVVLDDGSKLKLNTDSAVRVYFSASKRKVVLLQGEAFFEVARDPSKPFVVEARSEHVTAVGTAFSVDMSESASTEVLVTEGKVRVGRNTLSAPNSYPELFVTPGHKVVIKDDLPQVLTVDDAENQLAWREGIMVFEGETLAQAIKEIDRYTPLSFKIVDQSIATIPVGGYFKTGDLDQLLLVLEQNFGVKSYRLGDEVLLSKAQ